MTSILQAYFPGWQVDLCHCSQALVLDFLSKTSNFVNESWRFSLQKYVGFFISWLILSSVCEILYHLQVTHPINGTHIWIIPAAIIQSHQTLVHRQSTATTTVFPPTTTRRLRLNKERITPGGCIPYAMLWRVMFSWAMVEVRWNTQMTYC